MREDLLYHWSFYGICLWLEIYKCILCSSFNVNYVCFVTFSNLTCVVQTRLRTVHEAVLSQNNGYPLFKVHYKLNFDHLTSVFI